jgi:hypothetical protein
MSVKFSCSRKQQLAPDWVSVQLVSNPYYSGTVTTWQRPHTIKFVYLYINIYSSAEKQLKKKQTAQKSTSGGPIKSPESTDVDLPDLDETEVPGIVVVTIFIKA